MLIKLNVAFWESYGAVGQEVGDIAETFKVDGVVCFFVGFAKQVYAMAFCKRELVQFVEGGALTAYDDYAVFLCFCICHMNAGADVFG